MLKLNVSLWGPTAPYRLTISFSVNMGLGPMLTVVIATSFSSCIVVNFKISLEGNLKLTTVTNN